MKKILLSILTITLLYSSCAQIWSNPITGTNPGSVSPYTTGDVVSPNITVSGIGRGPGVAYNAANNRYNAKNWTTAASLDQNDYFYFTITPNSGYVLNFGSFSFKAQSSISLGPVNIVLRSSLDNYSADISSFTINSDAVEYSFSASLSSTAFQNLSVPVTFRLYAFGSNGDNGTFSVNEFAFIGAVALPVTFKNLLATQVNGYLNVAWSTETEINSDHFDIQLSNDGNIFTTIATVKTKARNGQSDILLNYSYTCNDDRLVLALLPALLGLLAVSRKRHKSLLLLPLIGLCLVATVCISCKKVVAPMNADRYSKRYVRVVQVDVDGNTSPSRVVQVVNE